MAEYLVKASYVAGDNGSMGVAFDINDLETGVSVTRGEIEDAVSNAIADAINTLLTAENVSNLSITAVRHFSATENITLT